MGLPDGMGTPDEKESGNHSGIIYKIESEDNYMADIKYDIVEEIGVLSENARGWRKELNRISWNGGEAKYDIRDWAPDHEKMGKGTTLTKDELTKLKELISSL